MQIVEWNGIVIKIIPLVYQNVGDNNPSLRTKEMFIDGVQENNREGK